MFTRPTSSPSLPSAIARKKDRGKAVNLACFALVLVIYLAGQLLIGTRLPGSGGWTFSAPIDNDTLYYAAMANRVKTELIPRNPAFAGERLFQSWLPMAPVAELMSVMSPYLAMRLMTLVCLLLLAWLLRRYLPDRWGLALLLVTIGAGLKYKVPSIGIDFIFKGFYHIPIYLALLVILFEKKSKRLRIICLLLLPWLHAFTAVAVFAYLCATFVIKQNKSGLSDLLVAVAGMLLYRVLLGHSDANPPHRLLLQGFYFDPSEAFLHAAIWLPFVLFSRRWDLWILFSSSFVLASLFHWNPFYFIYMLDFSVALLVGDSLSWLPDRLRRWFGPVVGLAVVLFVLYAVVVKFSRDVPVDMRKFGSALAWVSQNTPLSSVFAVAPPARGREEIELPLVQQIRALYYGVPHNVTDVGLDPDGQRHRAALMIYQERIVPPGVDFVFYGPFEQARFPHFSGLGREVYRDKYVQIFEVR